MAGFFVLPAAIHYGAVWVSAIVRKGKTGSYLGNLFGETHQEARSLKRYQNRGGDADDLMFRATASTAPTQPGTRVGDEINHDPKADTSDTMKTTTTLSSSQPNYSDNNEQPIHQSYSPRVTDSYVFAGIGGMNKLR